MRCTHILKEINRKYAKYALGFLFSTVRFLLDLIDAWGLYLFIVIICFYYFYSSKFKPKSPFPRKIFFSAFIPSVLIPGLLCVPLLLLALIEITSFKFQSFFLYWNLRSCMKDIFKFSNLALFYSDNGSHLCISSLIRIKILQSFPTSTRDS